MGVSSEIDAGWIEDHLESSSFAFPFYALSPILTVPETGGEPVPEPATVALLGIGIVGLAGAEVKRRWKKKAVDKSQVIFYQN